MEVLEIENAELSARILDRTGRPVNIPLKVEHMQDGDGVRWASVQLVLAPLAPADYLVELTQTPSTGSTAVPQTLVAFRIVP
jgi:hypothetical protein